MPDTLTESTVMDALSRVEDPELHRDIVSLNMVRDLAIKGETVSMTLMLTTPACPLTGPFKESVEQALLAIPGVSTAEVNLDAEVRGHSPAASDKRPVEGVKNIVAVASNKGGVGKSTVSTNIAVALARHGAKVGLLDADITGPNIPTMMGFPPGHLVSNGGMRAEERYGVRVCSLGFALPAGTPVVWRGPMIGSAVRDFLHNIDWGELDYLIVDLPPGTSDASMSMTQEAPIAGVVIVSTPQDVALEDAKKAVAMFDKLQVPVFGIVENMSYFIAPDTGNRYEIFGHGGAMMAAEELGIEFLGEIPLDPAARQGADAGKPIVDAAPESNVAMAFMSVAEKIAARCSVQSFIEETT